MADAVLDDLGHDLVGALQHAPRAPFELIGKVIDATPRTVGRRYNELVHLGLLRVTGEVDWSVQAAVPPPVHLWIRTAPGMTHSVAADLVRRSDTTFVAVATGHGDVFCTLHGTTDSMAARALTVDIPALAGVVSTSTEWVIRRLTSSSAWRLQRLSNEQVSALRNGPTPHESIRRGQRRKLGDIEISAVKMLLGDARVPFSKVADMLQISESRARRLVTSVLETGVIRPRVEIEPRLLGHRLEVVLSIQCDPRHIEPLALLLTRHSSARFVTMTAGTATFIFQGVFRDEDDLAHFVSNDLGGTDNVGVTNLECSVLLEVVKRYWMPELSGDKAFAILPEMMAARLDDRSIDSSKRRSI